MSIIGLILLWIIKRSSEWPVNKENYVSMLWGSSMPVNKENHISMLWGSSTLGAEEKKFEDLKDGLDDAENV